MLTIQEIERITKGNLVQRGRSPKVNGVSIDSRNIKKGNAYIAIKGQRFNGHDFISAARRKGAVAVVVSQKVAVSNDLAVIMVKDTTKALGHIAAWHRRRFDIPVIAITGSTGKTTTKEMTAAVMGQRYNVLKNTKTENNHFGVPLTLLRLTPSHEAVVLEFGTNQPGDIRWLSQIAGPTTAVFTNIGDSHLQGLKNRRGVFREKTCLIQYLPTDGTVILNKDDYLLSQLIKKNMRQKIISYACDTDAHYKARNVLVVNNHRLDFTVGRHTFTVRSPARHNVSNALAAISCGLRYKISYNDIRSALARVRFSNARQAITMFGQNWIIDDTYNSNPLSLESAIRTLNSIQIKGKRIAVCGDMLELGTRSKVLHQNAGRMIACSQTDVILTTGRQARYTAQAVVGSGEKIQAIHCEGLNDLHRVLKRICNPGDAILVKGSRGMHLERTVKFLKKNLNG